MKAFKPRPCPLTTTRSRSLLTKVAALILTLFIVGCGSSSDDFADINNYNPEPTPAPILYKMSVVYKAPTTEDFLPIQQALEQSEFYEGLAQALSETLIFPRDVTVSFEEVGQVNAFWQAGTNQITISYELIADIAKGMDFDSSDPSASETAYINASLLVVMHEIGHCFVTLFDLPITGREDDAVDEFAAIVLSQMQNKSPFSALVAGAQWFYDSAEAWGDTPPEWLYADEHSMGKQRFYAILFLAYGSNPDAYQYLINDGIITEEQADNAVNEYKNKVKVWEQLLSPFER